MPAAPRNTIWPLEPHTAAKHAILEKYLNAWLPIMTAYNGRVVFMDAFAGPGEYSGGERGSPLIALDAVLGHRYDPVRTHAKIEFVFIEQDPQRCAHLAAKLATRTRPNNVRYQVKCGAFIDEVVSVFPLLRDESGRPAPLFAFLDPFGYSDTPIEIVGRIMRQDKSEVLINFMHENINRFLAFDNAANQAHLDALFGTTRWRDIIVQELPPKERERRVHDLYQNQLRTVAGASYVRSFRMRNRQNATEYYLFFATKNLTGLDKMKQAMWHVDPSGAYDFSDFTDPDQLILFQPTPEHSRLRAFLQGRFGGQVVTVQEIQNYVIADTPFHSGQYKREVLKPMEADREITVVWTQGKRPRGTFGDMSMKIRFI
jgi:three-Cys-motif partner protein